MRRQTVEAAAYRARHHALDMGEAQGQGYVGQALGAADMFASVYADQLRYRADDPHWAERDRFLLSTGHYAIGLYAAPSLTSSLSASIRARQTLSRPPRKKFTSITCPTGCEQMRATAGTS